MKQKLIKFKISKPEHYLRLFNGIYGLTKSERDVLAEFLLIHLSLAKVGSTINPFCADMKKRVAHRMDKKSFNSLNTYIKALSDKGAIMKVDGGYRIHSNLLPAGEDQIVFRIK